MRITGLVFSLLFCASLVGFAAPLDMVGDDDASQSGYGSGWSTDKGAGEGFGKWNLLTKTEGDNSYAGFYIASNSDKADLKGISIGGKAFGLFANGPGFEEAAAFRSFDRPLQAGQSFSLLMEHKQFVQKNGSDGPAGGACGVTLLPDAINVSGAEDYNKGSRFEFGYDQTESGYMVYDGDGRMKLDIPFTDTGLAVTLTLVSPDTYNLEVTVLTPRHTYHLDHRKLGGTAGNTLGGFCIFDRNGETYDVYFNGFQILQRPAAAGL